METLTQNDVVIEIITKVFFTIVDDAENKSKEIKNRMIRKESVFGIDFKPKQLKFEKHLDAVIDMYIQFLDECDMYVPHLFHSPRFQQLINDRDLMDQCDIHYVFTPTDAIDMVVKSFDTIIDNHEQVDREIQKGKKGIKIKTAPEFENVAKDVVDVYKHILTQKQNQNLLENDKFKRLKQHQILDKIVKYKIMDI
jgi:hypothetical protein